MLRGAPDYSPDFDDLVLEEVHAETREQILRLKSDIEVSQFYNFLQIPENQSLISLMSNLDFNLNSLDLEQKEKLRHLLIIAKLLLVKDSENNYVSVNETVEDMISQSDRSILNQSGDFRDGVLPLFSFFNVVPGCVFRSIDGRDLSQVFNNMNNVSKVLLDFSSEPVLTNITFNSSDGSSITRQFIKIACFYDSNGTQYPARMVFMPVDSLIASERIELFQNNISESSTGSLVETGENNDISRENLLAILELDSTDSTIEPLLQTCIDRLDEIMQIHGVQLAYELVNFIINKYNPLIPKLSEQLGLLSKILNSQQLLKVVNIIKQSVFADIQHNYHYFIDNVIEFQLLLGDKFLNELKSFVLSLCSSRNFANNDRKQVVIVAFLNQLRLVYGSESNFIINFVFDTLCERLNFEFLDDLIDEIDNNALQIKLKKLFRDKIDNCFSLENSNILFENNNFILDILGDELFNIKLSNLVNNCMLNREIDVLTFNYNFLASRLGADVVKQKIRGCFQSFIYVRDFNSLFSNLNTIAQISSLLPSDFRRELFTSVVRSCLEFNGFDQVLVLIAGLHTEFDQDFKDYLVRESVSSYVESSNFGALERNFTNFKVLIEPQKVESFFENICRLFINHSNSFRLFSFIPFINQVIPNKAEEIINLSIHTCIENEQWNELLLNFKTLNSTNLITNETWLLIINNALQSRMVGNVLSVALQIKSTLNYEPINSVIDSLVPDLIREKKFVVILNKLEAVEQIHGPEQTINILEDIYQELIDANKYDMLFKYIGGFKQYFTEELFLSRSQSIIENLCEQNKWSVLIENYKSFKEVFGVLNARNVFSNILDRALIANQYRLLLDSSVELISFDIDWYCKVIISAIRTGNRSLMNFIDVSRVDVLEFLLNNYLVFQEVFAGDASTIFVEILERANVCDNQSVFFRYIDILISINPEFISSLLTDYRLCLENFEILYLTQNYHYIELALETARFENNYEVLLNYVPRLLLSGVLDNLPGIDTSLYLVFAEFDSRNGQVFNTDDGFELYLTSPGSDSTTLGPMSYYKVLRYDHNFNLVQTVTEQDLRVDIEALYGYGLSYSNNLLKPYAFLRNIIDSHRAFESGDKSFFMEKRFNVIFLPGSDHNNVFNKSSSNYYNHNENTLVFELGSENSFYDQLRALNEFGVHVDLMIIGGHGSQDTINFNESGDPRFDNFENSSEQSILNFHDREDLMQLSNLSILEGSDIILQSCSTGQTTGSRDNMVDLIGSTIGQNSRVIGPRIPIQFIEIKRFNGENVYQYYEGSGVKSPLYLMDNRPSDQ